MDYWRFWVSNVICISGLRVKLIKLGIHVNGWYHYLLVVVVVVNFWLEDD